MTDTIIYREMATYRDAWMNVSPGTIGSTESSPLHEARATQDLHGPLGTLIRAAAFETGAVEDLYLSAPGVTQVVAESRPGWEAAVADAGQGATDRFADQLNGYRWARDYAHSASEHPINESLIREIHSTVCASQNTVQTSNGPRPLRRGQYKQTENFVIDRWGTRRDYCPPDRVTAEMGIAIDIFRDLEAASSPDAAYDTLRSAAFLHWAFAHIHPFEDGNGRTARVLASIPLIRAYAVPAMVFADRKQAYLQALDETDRGNPAAFLEYTTRRTLSTLTWRDNLTSVATDRAAADTALDIRHILDAQTEPAESGTIVIYRVKEHIHQQMEQALADTISTTNATHELSGHYRNNQFVAPDTHQLSNNYTIRITEPLPASIDYTEDVSVASTRDVTVSFSSEGGNYSYWHRRITLSFEDCSPSLSNEARTQLETFCALEAAYLTEQLLTEVTTAARSRGTLPATGHSPHTHP
ncbi:Fic family protein [Microbacterium sp. 1P10UB]|uniref:Fic family protein n=1 Tax=unclassified Microbacterium TaxID=2609290 RepID=UPI0039A2F893